MDAVRVAERIAHLARYLGDGLLPADLLPVSRAAGAHPFQGREYAIRVGSAEQRGQALGAELAPGGDVVRVALGLLNLAFFRVAEATVEVRAHGA